MNMNGKPANKVQSTNPKCKSTSNSYISEKLHSMSEAEQRISAHVLGWARVRDLALDNGSSKRRSGVSSECAKLILRGVLW